MESYIFMKKLLINIFDYFHYVFFDLKGNPFFKLIYILEKCLKYPVFLINQHFHTCVPLPYFLKKDYTINNNDGKRRIKGSSGDDFIVSSFFQRELRDDFLSVTTWTFFDIGSHVGKRAVIVGKRNPNVNIYIVLSLILILMVIYVRIYI